MLDCIEFDDRLRRVDSLDEAAFLAMDLERLGAPGLAADFLSWYPDFAADPAPAALRHHYVAYRAYVRAKVACPRHAQGDAAAADVAAHADPTLRHLRAGAARVDWSAASPAPASPLWPVPGPTLWVPSCCPATGSARSWRVYRRAQAPRRRTGTAATRRWLSEGTPHSVRS